MACYWKGGIGILQSSIKRVESSYYEQSGVWARYDNNTADYARRKKTIAMIPEDALSLVDVGCGNGALTNLLNKPLVLGLDFARFPLRELKCNAIQASIVALPLRSDIFDVAISCEVLEHLDNESLSKAIKELNELKSQYLLISVPFNEDLTIASCKCSKCTEIFHPFHHRLTFDSITFENMLTNYLTLRIKFSTYKVPPNKLIARIAHKAGVYNYSSYSTCPKCGGKPKRTNRLLRYVFSGLQLIDETIRKTLRQKEAYHQILLLQRRPQNM